MCRVEDTRHLKCTGESIVQQIDPEEREKRDYGVLWRKIGKGTMCVHNTKTVTHRASEARTFPQRLRHASCGWSRLTASRLSLLAPERLGGGGRERGKNATPERAVPGSQDYCLTSSHQEIQAEPGSARPLSAVSPVPFCGTYQGVLSHAIHGPVTPDRCSLLGLVSEGGVRGLQVDGISNT